MAKRRKKARKKTSRRVRRAGVSVATAVNKKPRKPKLRKLPKLPKQGASLETHKNWEARAKPIIAENDRKMSEYKRKVKAYENTKSAKDRIRRLKHSA